MSLFSAKESIAMNVEGMHCEKCVSRVHDALSALDGVTSVTVDLSGASAVVEGHGIDRLALVPAIEDLGFHASLK